MKNAKIILALVTLLIGSSALASCPDNVGVYQTLDGSLLPGRAAEAWCDAPEGPGQPGNTANAMSWDGSELGSQWHIYGMMIDAAGATLISDSVDGNGNGERDYQTFYDGGEIHLDGSGPWTDGDVDLHGLVNYFRVLTTIYFVDGNPVGQASNITFTGDFVDCPENNCFVEFAIANAILAWNSNMDVPMPANYPDFLCDATMGELFQNNDVIISINCDVVATENVSWSGLKGLYR